MLAPVPGPAHVPAVGGVTHLRHDDWVDGEAWRNEPSIGLFVIVERRHVGLVPHHEPHNLRRGSTARFRVSNLFADGKMELSLRAHAHEELKLDAEKVLERLRSGTLRVGDNSSPEQIRQLFGLSKKAFKRAIGTLLVRRVVRIDEDLPAGLGAVTAGPPGGPFGALWYEWTLPLG